MAREYGKLYVRAWGDKDFTALPASAQRMYMFLASQPDLSNCGTITFALRRWAGCVGDEEPDDIMRDLMVLSAHRFVVVDMDCEEVLVRSYIKWDGGWRSPNMMVSIKAAATQALSETIRATLRDEIGRLDTSHLPTRISEKTGRSTRDFIELLIGQVQDILKDCEVDETVANWGKETLSETLSEGVCQRVTETLSDLNPSAKGYRRGLPKGSITTTAIDTTDTTDTTATAIDTTDTTAKNRVQPEPYSEDFERFWQVYPSKHGKRAASKAFDKALERASVDEIVAGAERYRNDPNRDPTYTKFAQGWLNDGRWSDGPLPPRGDGRSRSQSNQNANAALVMRYAAEESAPPLELGVA